MSDRDDPCTVGQVKRRRSLINLAEAATYVEMHGIHKITINQQRTMRAITIVKQMNIQSVTIMTQRAQQLTKRVQSIKP